MQVLVPIVVVLIALYGALLVVKPRMAFQRNQNPSKSSLMIARIKGLAAIAIAVFALKRFGIW